MSDVREFAESMGVVRHVAANDPSALDRVRVYRDFASVDFILRSKAFRVLDESDGFGREISGPILHGTLVRIDGPEHFARRRIESALFRSPTLRRYEADILRPALERVLSELRARQVEGEPVRADLRSIGEEVLGELVGSLVGLDGINTPEGHRALQSYYQDIDNGVRINWLNAGLEEMAAKAVTAMGKLTDEFITPSLRRREALLERITAGEIPASEMPADLISLMLQNKDAYPGFEDGGMLTREVSLYLTASITTLINQMCHLIHHVEDWVVAHPEYAERRADPVFLSQALRETVRLHGGPVLMRKATEDAVLPTGETVREGDLAWLMVRDASTDGDVFVGTPDAFDPTREVPDGVMPFGVEFGVGRHTCIGKRFAIGDDPDSKDPYVGAGALIMHVLYHHGMRLDPERSRSFLPDNPEVHASVPILLTRL